MPLRYWLFVLLTLALTGVIGYGTYATARLLRTWRPDRNLLLLPGETIIRLVLVGIFVSLGWLSDLPPEQFGWVFVDIGDQVVWGIAWGLVIAAFFIIATQVVTEVTGHRFYSYLVIDHILPKGVTQTILVVLAMVLVVLVEELLFRSLLLGGMTPILPPFILILVVGLLFGLMHSPQGLWGIVGASLAGIMLGVLFFQAGSILMPIVAHFIANMAQIGWAMAHRDED